MTRDQLVKKANELWKIGIADGFRVIRWRKGGNVDYEWAREISNSRFDLQPVAVALPQTAHHVASCVDFCVKNKIKFRVRSGGHQHEGMCSIQDGFMIRLSEMNTIEYETIDGTDYAWIGVGKPLNEIYDELQTRGQTIPGGGCWSVNVGGLALGGGWGTSVRKMGLTCDNFVKVEMVTAEADVIYPSAECEDYGDLFWALRGGGGGNFGIVTRFLFRLSDIGPVVSTVSMRWDEKEENLAGVVRHYLDTQASYPLELTTSMGLRAKHEFEDKKKPHYPITFIGKFYGKEADLKEIMRPFLCAYPPSFCEFKEERQHPHKTPQNQEAQQALVARASFSADDSAPLSETISDLVDFVSLAAVPSRDLPARQSVAKQADYDQKAPPGTTCLAPWPHKISSGFPKNREAHEELARKAIEIILETPQAVPNNAARLYMTLHGMPGPQGGIRPSETAFFWRDKELIVQFQAWWAKPCLPDGKDSAKKAYNAEATRYVSWIKESRKKLEPELEGAFINFVDKDLSVKTYYGDNLPRLIEIKNKYDPHNVFQFPLSIPTKDD